MKVQHIIGLLLALTCLVSNVFGASVISGQLQTCERTSDILAEQSCKEKLSVSLTLSSGEVSQFEYEMTSITKDSSSIPLNTPIKVSVAIEDNRVIYPLQYVKTFNGKPIEKVIVRNDFLVAKCDDSPGSNQPTCGWQFNSNKEKIQNSQGFCCECEFSDTLGLSNSDLNTRGGINCKQLIRKQSSGHCLVLDDINYMGFTLEAPTIVYRIKIEMTIGESKQVLSLTPSLKTQSVSGFGANLVGSFAPSQQISSFSNMMLFAAEGDNEIASAGAKYMMLIDKSYISLTGSECDKIGTLYSAFRTQPNGCKQKPMTCLQNQLLDFHNSDIERIRTGKIPQYHIVRYGEYDMKSVNSIASLVLVPKEMTVAMINLVIDARSITSIIAKSTGKIESAVLGPVDMSNQAKLTVQVTNTGQISANFLVSVDCSSEVVNALPQKTIWIEKGATSSQSWSVFSASVEKASGSCLISLLDATGSVLDQKQISFENNALTPVSGDIPVDSSGAIKEKQDGNFFDQLFTISKECKQCKLYNVVCFIISGCFSYLLIFGAVFLGIGLMLLVVGLFLYFGGAKLMIRMVKRCK